MKQMIKKILLVLVMGVVVLQPMVADAQLVKCGLKSQDTPDQGKVYVQDGACTFSDLWELAYSIVNWMLGMAGFVAVAFIVWGGFLMLTSFGNQDRIKEAKATIYHAILGLVLTLMAYLIVGYVAGLVLPNASGDPLQNLLNFLKP